jgi:tetratricopeptide (TPR) repeat protein
MEECELAEIEKGIKLQREGRLRDAEVAYRAALKLNPTNANALHLLGTLAFQVGKYEIAVQLIQRALKLSPTSAHFYNNCGPALRALGRFEEAVDSYRKAIELQPSLPHVWYNLGKCYSEAGQTERALKAYNRQLELGGDQASTRWNRSLANLALGNFQDGWRDYELRWQATPAAASRRNFTIPAWTGEPLNGKTLFIYAEQGLGDTIQFIRYAPLVVERGGRVVVECQPELVRLIQSMPSIEKVIPKPNAFL